MLYLYAVVQYRLLLLCCNCYFCFLGEDKYIEEGLLGSQYRSRRLYNMAEERFTNAFQTVVLWSTKDVVANKKWSEDTFNTLMRQERQSKLSAKRQKL